MSNRIIKKRWIKRILILGILLITIFTYYYLPRIIVEIDNPLISVLISKKKVENPPKYDRKTGEYFTFNSFDDTSIETFITYAKTDSVKGTILLVHGLRADKELFINVAEDLANRGYQTVAIDLRAHGNSEGDFCTFGVKEKEDIKALLDTLDKQNPLKGPVGIWGFSLGGAVAMQAMAEDKRIQFGLIESTFNSMKNISHSYTKRLVGFNWEPFTDFMVNRSGQIAEFNPNEASPLQVASNIQQPIVIVHGIKDERIPWEEGQRNFEALGSENKKFIKVEDAYHTTLWRSNTMDYLPTIYNEIDRMAEEIDE